MRERPPEGSAVPPDFSRSLHRRYGAFTLAFVVFVLVMALAERKGLPRGWIGVAFLMVTVAAYAGIGLLCRTASEAEYFVAGRRVPAMYNGLATAADWMSAASFIGTAGVLYLQGFAGLGIHPRLDRAGTVCSRCCWRHTCAVSASTRSPISWGRATAARCRA